MSIEINGIALSSQRAPRQNEVLTADALSFLAALHRQFWARVTELEEAGALSEGVSVAAQDGDDVVELSWNAFMAHLLSTPPSTIVRPRGLARREQRMLCQGTPLSAGLVDLGLYLHRNARRLLAEGRAPFVELPLLESEEEVQLWQDIFTAAERLLGLPARSVRAIHLQPKQRAFHREQTRLAA
ncbi:hypothetical protein M3B43_08190 [Nesterenkonia massiliensis]|uniref:malate synthase n=1 Tax=Nesterenkonia massiliensis TaxID=1232429 RepID=A0ABT2HRI7_9MICC|nr:hypothetical protein [Nesterenkonia massiliensis]MCT1607304.1 hypothetical protein [Nesterenkonia massiliensis]